MPRFCFNTIMLLQWQWYRCSCSTWMVIIMLIIILIKKFYSRKCMTFNYMSSLKYILFYFLLSLFWMTTAKETHWNQKLFTQITKYRTQILSKKNVHNQTFHKLPLPQQKQKLTDLQWEKITRFVFLNEVYRVLKLDM